MPLPRSWYGNTTYNIVTRLGPVLWHVYSVMDFPPFLFGQYFWIQSLCQNIFHPHFIGILSPLHVSASHPIICGPGPVLWARVNNHNLLQLLSVSLPLCPFVVHFILYFHGWWLYFTFIVTWAHQSLHLHFPKYIKDI